MVIGYIIARILKAVVIKILTSTKLFTKVEELKIPEKESTVDIIGRLTFYLVMLFVLLAFFNVLNLPIIAGPVSTLVDTVMEYLPRVGGAAIILIIAWGIAKIVKLVILKGFEEIKPSMIEAYQQKRLTEINYRGAPYKPASVNRELEVMRRIYNLAMREEMVGRNPCWKVPRLSERNARDRMLSKEEFDKLITGLPQHAADIVTVAYHKGMRAGEIFDLTWDRVNMKEGYFNLTPKDTKTGEARHVYFNEVVKGILERLKKVRHLSHQFVFTYKGNPVKSIKYSLTKALERTGIGDFRFHDLRHTYVSNSRKAGVDRTVIMKLTGHRTLSMFARYNTVDEADAREAMRRLESYFGEAEEPTAAIVLQEQKGVRNNPLTP